MDEIQEFDDDKDSVWECRSQLYDSFELNSIQRPIDSAIASLAMSIGRQSNLPQSVRLSNKPEKLPSSIPELLRSVLRRKPRSVPNRRGTDSSDGGKVQAWDCGSTLYDSFEFNSIKILIDSAIASRSTAPPELTDRRSVPASEKHFKPSIHKLLRSVCL